MRLIPVVKMTGAGNDFLMLDNFRGALGEKEMTRFARSSCPRRTSAGADGVIALCKSEKDGHDFRMRIFNADGSEAEMCGNGARCAAVFANQLGLCGVTQVIETLAGTLHATVADDSRSAKIQLSQPGAMTEHANLDLPGGPGTLYLIDTGVPHAIEFVEDLAKTDVKTRGAAIRYHQAFQPRGTNANFVQLAADGIRLRTYERGVEDETLACGTGATAAALVAGLVKDRVSPLKVEVATGDTLTIHFELDKDKKTAKERPYLEGPVKSVYKGEFYWE